MRMARSISSTKVAHVAEYDSCTRAVRVALVVGNGILCCLGALVIAVGIYLVVERIHFVPYVYGTQLMAASCYLIITAGVILFLISFIGCSGAVYENRSLLIIYCIVLSAVFILGMLGSVLAIVYWAWVMDMVRYYMTESLLSTYGYQMENGGNNLVTRSWDEVQEKFGCCAVNDQGWLLYRESFWFKDLPGMEGVDKPFVPASCCKTNGRGAYVDRTLCQYYADGPPGMTGLPSRGVTTGVNNAIYYRGCFTAGKEVFKQITVYLIVIGFIMAVLVIVGIVLSLHLYGQF